MTIQEMTVASKMNRYYYFTITFQLIKIAVINVVCGSVSASKNGYKGPLPMLLRLIKMPRSQYKMLS
jgi:hypothetical protein